MQVFIKPLFSALIMGGIAYLIYTAVYLVLPINVIALGLAVLFAVAVYGIAMLLCGGITEDTLDNIPKGDMLKPLVRKFAIRKRKD